jgi:GDP-L-fucose synthase
MSALVEAASPYDLRGKRVWVAGHRGMVGSAIVRRLASEDCEILSVGRQQLDLRNQDQVKRWMVERRPHAVFLAAAKVGGILANASQPADFIYDNLSIETNIIHSAHQTGVEKLLFLSSSCVYPRLAPQPMREDALLTGPLEPTNEWYAVAKIAGMKLCAAYRRQFGCDYISAMPANLYGPGDNYDPASSHVAAALQVKVHQAKLATARSMSIWGSGTPRREFLFVDDLADALVFLMKRYSDEQHVNVGTGTDITIRALAELIARVAGWSGSFEYDSSKPDGMPRKVMDVLKLGTLGWSAKTDLEKGFELAYRWYVEHKATSANARASG